MNELPKIGTSNLKVTLEIDGVKHGANFENIILTEDWANQLGDMLRNTILLASSLNHVSFLEPITEDEE